MTINKLSKIFNPKLVIPKNVTPKNQDVTSKSQRLMTELGLIKPIGNGLFHLLPLLQRSIDKCIKIIDFHMDKVNAQKMTIPQLTPVELWKKSGRFESGHTELLTCIDRHQHRQVLGPTHEETITAMLATVAPISYRQFPLKLYQIGTKFRDELKPRFGLMRAKEFLMKDCYTFDIDQKAALETYDEMNEAYEQIFKMIGVPFLKVKGDTGSIGGSTSQEFHFAADVGEDSLEKCKNCNYSVNTAVTESVSHCPSCERQEIVRMQGIEVGHTFLLDDKYSKALGATFLHRNGKPQPLLMGCYGIGVTRLLGAALESLSTDTEIRWPFVLAPFSVCIIPPKDGSKEETFVSHYTEELYIELTKVKGLNGSVIVDDRSHLTIGKRLIEAKRFGFPIVVIIGPKASGEFGKFEMHLTNDELCLELSFSEIVQYAERIINEHHHQVQL